MVDSLNKSQGSAETDDSWKLPTYNRMLGLKIFSLEEGKHASEIGDEMMSIADILSEEPWSGKRKYRLHNN